MRLFDLGKLLPRPALLLYRLCAQKIQRIQTWPFLIFLEFFPIVTSAYVDSNTSSRWALMKHRYSENQWKSSEVKRGITWCWVKCNGSWSSLSRLIFVWPCSGQSENPTPDVLYLYALLCASNGGSDRNEASFLPSIRELAVSVDRATVFVWGLKLHILTVWFQKHQHP